MQMVRHRELLASARPRIKRLTCSRGILSTKTNSDVVPLEIIRAADTAS
jgi:hypothetical protein